MKVGLDRPLSKGGLQGLEIVRPLLDGSNMGIIRHEADEVAMSGRRLKDPVTRLHPGNLLHQNGQGIWSGEEATRRVLCLATTGLQSLGLGIEVMPPFILPGGEVNLALIRTLADVKAMLEAGATRIGASASVAIVRELGAE